MVREDPAHTGGPMLRHSFSDKELVGQVLHGRTEAYAQLVERHIHGAHAIAYARAGNVPDAEDAVQEAFLRAFEKLRTLRDPAKFGSWLLTIARHEATRLVVKGRSTLGADPAATPDVAAANIEPVRHELHALLRDHIANLPEHAREVLLLHYFAGRNTREIATLLDLRQGAVLKRLQRARESLAETLLHDLESTRPAHDTARKQIAHIVALAAALPAASSLAAPAAAAALGTNTLSSLAALFPKAGTIAAACAGMAVTATAGWMYLSAQPPDPIEAADTETRPPVAAPAPEAAAKVETIETPDTTTIEPASSANPAPIIQLAQAEPDAAPAPAEAAPTRYPNATGDWEFSFLFANTEENRLGKTKITDLGAMLTFMPEQEHLRALYHEVHRVGVQITLTLNSPDASGTLTGAFNETFTELILNGAIRMGPAQADAVPVEAKLTGKRVAPGQLSRAQRIESLREDMTALNTQLERFIADTGAYPKSIDDLHPRYIADLAPYRSTSTRTIAYHQPTAHDEAAIRQLTFAALSAESAQDLMSIEERLVTLWSDRFMGAAAIIDVRDTELDVHLQLRTLGRIDVVDDPKPAPADLAPAVKTMRAQAQNASCMNNLKQLGIVTKMFQGEQQHGLTPTGWHMTYPTFMADTRILTCPGEAPGAVSYEILFPGASEEWMHALARTVEGLPADAPVSTLTAAVPLIIEIRKCSGIDGRNVIFLDGHVERFNDDRWSTEIAPYLAYR